MALNINKGIRKDAQRVVIYGPEGIGKTTLASQFPEPLFIDLEEGSTHQDVDRISDVNTWVAFGATLTEIIKSNNSAEPLPYKTIVIDTADKLEALAAKYVCEKNGKSGIEEFGYGKGYTYLKEAVNVALSYFDIIRKQGINVVVVAHSMMRKFEQPDEMGAYDRWELKLNKNVAPLFKEWSDMLIFCNYKTNVVLVDGGKAKAQGASRMMYLNHNACWDAKNRDGLPDEMPLEYESIRTAIEGE